MTTTRIPDGQMMMQEMYAVKSGEMAETLSESFSSVMERAEESKTEVTNLVSTDTTTTKAETVKPTENKKVQDADSSKQDKDDLKTSHETKETDKSAKVEDKKEVSEETKKVVKEVTKETEEAVAKTLGITVEELSELMQLLGMTMADLTEPGNVAKLMVEANTEVDFASVMMDETLLSEMKEIVATVTQSLEQAAAELSVSVDGLKTQIAEVMGETDVPTFAEMAENGLNVEMPVGQTEQVVAQTTAQNVSDDKEETVVSKENVTVVDATDTKADETVMTVTDAQTKANADDSDDAQMQQQSRGEHVAMQQQTVAQQSVVQTEVQMQPESYIDVERAREIINQVAEQVKMRASEQITEMEIQLNPANLGRINLQVTAREGVITAQIATTNEDVRAALEMQAMALKEELNQQGLKVDAVDVTVSSHEFERNLEDGQQQSAEEEAYKEELRKGTRKSIDLNELTNEDLAEMSEAEMIQIDMMNRRGNRMNLMA